MFLEERLNNILKTLREEDKNRWLKLALDECVSYIAERTKVGTPYAELAGVVKQADTIWRQFCDRHSMPKPICEAFTTLYINERMLKHPQLRNYFKNK